jgi:glycosyltransferase involved in cell wall biosynthesis
VRISFFTAKNSLGDTHYVLRDAMRIAMLGVRGVPTVHGGFETCAEQLGARLVERGHQVTIYCRPHFVDSKRKEYRGMRLVTLPTVKNKYLDTLVHTFVGSLHALFRPYDICLYFIAGNSVVCWIPRLSGKRTVINVDGLDWKREKWPGPAKRYLQLAERLAPRLANAALTDSQVVQRYYAQSYRSKVYYIAYGSELEPVPPGETLRRWGLEARNYILFVGRLVPENHAEHLIEAFQGLEDRGGMKCVIVGDASYQDDYMARLKEDASDYIIFTGYVYGNDYKELSANAYCFVETSSASGTHPALLEAMGYGNCVIVNDTPENLETIGKAGLSYDGSAGARSLRPLLQQLIDRPEVVEEQRALAAAHARKHYSWDVITGQYLALFNKVLSRSHSGSRRATRTGPSRSDSPSDRPATGHD